MTISAIGSRRVLPLAQAALLLSQAWISRPVELPLALGAPLLLVLQAYMTHGRRLRVDAMYSLLLMLMAAFLVGHWLLGDLDAADLGWQFLRLVYPMAGACAFSASVADLGDSDRRRFLDETTSFMVVLLAIEAVLRMALVPELALTAILGDVEASYNFKSESLLFVDANVIGFVALYLFAFELIRRLIDSPPGKASDIRLLALSLVVGATFSRQAWYGLVATFFLYLVRLMTLRSVFMRRRAASPTFLVILSIVGGVGSLVAGFQMRESLVEDVVTSGSLSTKLDIAAYGWGFLESASPVQLLFGVGPQRVFEDAVVTYVGHSLVGIYVEFGIFIGLLFVPWIRRRGEILLFAPLLLGAVTSVYPYAYLLPVFCLHLLLAPCSSSTRCR